MFQILLEAMVEFQWTIDEMCLTAYSMKRENSPRRKSFGWSRWQCWQNHLLLHPTHPPPSETPRLTTTRSYHVPPTVETLPRCRTVRSRRCCHRRCRTGRSHHCCHRRCPRYRTRRSRRCCRWRCQHYSVEVKEIPVETGVVENFLRKVDLTELQGEVKEDDSEAEVEMPELKEI